MEDTEAVFVAGIEQCFQVSFKVATGAGPGTVVIETPHAAIGQDAPTNAAPRSDLGRRKVSEDLAVGRTGHGLAVLITGIQSEAEAFALFHHQRVQVAVAGLPLGRSTLLGGSVGKKQVIGNVFVTDRALLRQVVGPSERLQDGTDQILLGGGFVGVCGTAEGIVPLTHAVPERGKRLRPGDRGFPLGRGLYAVGEEVVGE